jgi:hypothetical protein
MQCAFSLFFFFKEDYFLVVKFSIIYRCLSNFVLLKLINVTSFFFMIFDGDWPDAFKKKLN